MIIFERKFERARKLMQERRGEEHTGTGRDDVEISDMLEKHDVLAMVIAALITILPVALIVLVGLSLIGYFFIVR